MCVSEPTLTHWAALKWVTVTATATATVTHCLQGSPGIAFRWFRVPDATFRGRSPKYAVNSPNHGAQLNNTQKINFYFTQNTLRLRYKDHVVNYVERAKGGE
jgi:hypothetical protein